VLLNAVRPAGIHTALRAGHVRAAQDMMVFLNQKITLMQI